MHDERQEDSTQGAAGRAGVGKATSGVMLMAYGAPSSLDDVAEVFAHIRGGRRPPEERIEDLRERYRAIGGGAPLLRITADQARALEDLLARDGGEPVKVIHGMRHSRPFIHETIRGFAGTAVRRIVGLALAPHHSSLSVGAYHRALREAAAVLDPQPDLVLVDDFHAHPGFVGAWAEVLSETMRMVRRDPRGGITVLFTAHSLPERILAAGEPYREQCLATARLVAERSGVEEWRLAFQSASATGEPWLGPDVLDLIGLLTRENRREIVVAPIGFVSDHLEVLYDVDILCRRAAEEGGARLWRTPMMNTRPTFIAALGSVVREALSGRHGTTTSGTGERGRSAGGRA